MYDKLTALLLSFQVVVFIHYLIDSGFGLFSNQMIFYYGTVGIGGVLSIALISFHFSMFLILIAWTIHLSEKG